MSEQINNLVEHIKSSPKRKLVCLSTTANVNNPGFYVGSTRETENTIAANFIFSALDNLHNVVSAFDPFVDCFLIDCEQKNSIQDFASEAKSLVKHSSIHYYKPNDITVDALDMWISICYPNIEKQKVTIVGPGNIGCKIAIKLAERGANVLLVGRRKEKTQQIVNGMQHFIRGKGSLHACTLTSEDLHNSFLLLGCTPGVPAITNFIVENLSENTAIIDVGNGTLTVDAISTANRKNIDLYCLSPSAAYAGFIEHWEQACQMQRKLGRRTLEGNITLISPGLIGKFGDVLVDDITSPSRIIGVCDGKGDILDPSRALPFKQKVKIK